MIFLYNIHMNPTEIYISRKEFNELMQQDLEHEIDMMITARRFMDKHHIDYRELTPA
jgi:hypothetical protein